MSAMGPTVLRSTRLITLFFFSMPAMTRSHAASKWCRLTLVSLARAAT